MQLRAPWIVITLAVLAGSPTMADPRVAGFVAGGAGELEGRVLDDAGHPVRGASVHVLASSGTEQVVTTDQTGRYRATTRPDETYSVVFVFGNAKIAGSVITTETVGDSEVVEMHEVVPPAVQPKPITSPSRVLAYSDAAMDHDTWTRTWLLLDVTATGTVKRIKTLDRAGYDLDRIAERAAFEVKFEPARDRSRRAIPALVLWSFEWPAYWWMRHHDESDMRRIPADASAIPCRGSGPTHSVYRDCRAPSVANAISKPWIERPRP
jgi:Carboxypeptidase regulatory-like domain